MDWRHQLRRNWSDRRLTGKWAHTGRTVFLRPLLDTGASPAPPPGPRQRLRRQLVERVLHEVDHGLSLGAIHGAPARSELRRIVDEGLAEADLTHLDPQERRRLEEQLASELYGLGPLDELIKDHTVSDILVNGPYDVWVDRHGRLQKTNVRFDDENHLLRLLSRLTAAHGRHIEEATPHVDVRLADGSRLHAMIPPLSSIGPVLAIRRARATPLRIEHLCTSSTLTPAMATFLGAVVESGLNILISGGASTGKTTLLNALVQFVPPEQRIVVIEETAELKLTHPHVIGLETRLANSEGRGEVSMRTLVRNALRMRADRIIVGEVRGAEVFDMVQAMNLGHSGSLTTVHANSAADAVRRLETLVLTSGFDLSSRAIRELLGASFHVIVHMIRQANGSRRVASISEVRADDGAVSTRDIFRFDAGAEAGAAHAATGHLPRFLDRLQALQPDIAGVLDGGLPPVHVARRLAGMTAASRAQGVPLPTVASAPDSQDGRA